MPIRPDYSQVTRYRAAGAELKVWARGIVIGMPLSEKELIRQIRRSARAGKWVVTGIGDDCAVLRVPPGHELLVTTDFPPRADRRICLINSFSLSGMPITIPRSHTLSAQAGRAIAGNMRVIWPDGHS